MRPCVPFRKVPPPCDIALRRSSCFRLVEGLDAVKSLAEFALCDLHVTVVLEVEPKLGVEPDPDIAIEGPT